MAKLHILCSVLVFDETDSSKIHLILLMCAF